MTARLSVLFVVVCNAVLLQANPTVNWSDVRLMYQRPPIQPILQSGNSFASRIVGGQEAKPHAFPYQVGLRFQLDEGAAWCGGSLISDEWILTAAHCTEKAQSAIAYLGAHNIKDDTESTQIRINVPGSNLVVHEKWSPRTLSNDISLIRLPNKVVLNENIQPINLPRRSQQNFKFEESDLIASGWGKDSDSAATVSSVLRWATLPGIKQSKCSIMYFGQIKKSHICAGNKGRSTCNGDSGGPLAYTETDGSKTLVGATSFGIGFGCEAGWPGVFTRVSSFSTWVAEKTGIALIE